MSGYNYKHYKNIPVQRGWDELVRKAGLDKIELYMINGMRMKLKDLERLVNEKQPETGLLIRRKYDEMFPPETHPTERMEQKIAKRAANPKNSSLKGNAYEKQWKVASGKAGLDERETELAKLMYMTPEQVLSMVPTKGAKYERWKDSPALHIRRLYDERHVHPSLVIYWKEHGPNLPGNSDSPYTKAFLSAQKKKKEKREKKRVRKELKNTAHTE